MADMPQNDGGSPVVRNILMVIGLLYVIGSVVFMVQAQNRINDMEKRQSASEQELLKKMTDSTGQLKASLNVLADKAGMNHKELSKKAAALQEQERVTAERLKTDEDSTKQQFGAVAIEVSGVKGDLGKVGSDVADTRNDLA